MKKAADTSQQKVRFSNGLIQSAEQLGDWFISPSTLSGSVFATVNWMAVKLYIFFYTNETVIYENGKRVSLRHQINPDLLQEASLQTKMANNKKEAETALSSNLVLGMFWISSRIQFGEGERMPSPQSLNSYRLQRH